MKRLLPGILVITLFFTCLVSPASAAGFDRQEYFSFDLLEYTSLNENGNRTTVGTSGVFEFQLPISYPIGYIDILCTVGTNAATAFEVSYDGTNFTELHTYNLGGYLYRASAPVSWRNFTSLYVRITSNSSANKVVNFLSIKCSSAAVETFDLPGKLSVRCTNPVYALDYQDSVNWAAGEGANILFHTGNYYDGDIEEYHGSAQIYYEVNQWQKYDYIYLYFGYSGYSLNSINAGIWVDDNFIAVPVQHNFAVDSSEVLSEYYGYVKCDISGIDRTLTSSLQIMVTGTYSMLYPRYAYQFSCYGTVDVPEPSKFAIFSNRISTWFTSLGNTISTEFSNLKLELATRFNGVTQWQMTIRDRINAMENAIVTKLQLIIDQFGNNRVDDELEDAKDTQEEVNVSINNQLVGAIEDWNTHIEIVETGYDSALTKTTPALMWIASLGDRVFNNMGWFANVYFLIGLISVFMLILSKSGLSRSIGAASRRK